MKKNRQLPTPLQTVIASYIRDGFSPEEAEREAQEWQKRMERNKAAIAAKQS